MAVRMKNLLFMVILSSVIWVSSCDEVQEAQAEVKDYCQHDLFKPRCQRNEVILMQSATYGRMRIGRCITNEEVAGFRPHFGDNPPNLGCSADVLSVLDRRCSGKSECEIRVIDISSENIKPCFPFLNVYLEASYTCISIQDEHRSCSVTVSTIPVHIIGSSVLQRICGTPSQPWMIEAPTGQRINVAILDFATSHSCSSGDESHPATGGHGLILDKTAKRNISICSGGAPGIAQTRETELHSSEGNALQIYFSPSSDGKDDENVGPFVLKLQSFGCLDIIPPEDAWLKRNEDTIAIGCYSSRQTWRLTCKGGNWVGVLGNCSQDVPIDGRIGELEDTRLVEISRDEQVLAMIAIGGCTLAISLAIMFTGAVCLRRFYAKSKSSQKYKTLNYSCNSQHSATNQRPHLQQQAPPGVFGSELQQVPTYSVYVGEDELFDTNRSAVEGSNN